MKSTALLISAVMLAAASVQDYDSAKEKFARIESEGLPAGSRVALSSAELNSFIEHELPSVTDGVQNPLLELLGPGLARGSALIDFAKLRRSQGHPPGWLMSKLLEGEHPVRVTASIRSAAGQATVDVQKVEISGIVINGSMLDFLIQHFLIPLYPTAAVGRPFALEHRMDRLEVQSGTVTVVIGR
ncbi:MAG: hypothetical protein JO323_25105 [Acidobacteriia bacterium]|nr:hypothetical protein [Terriglobia bacterium]